MLHVRIQFIKTASQDYQGAHMNIQNYNPYGPPAQWRDNPRDNLVQMHSQSWWNLIFQNSQFLCTRIAGAPGEYSIWKAGPLFRSTDGFADNLTELAFWHQVPNFESTFELTIPPCYVVVGGGGEWQGWQRQIMLAKPYQGISYLALGTQLGCICVWYGGASCPCLVRCAAEITINFC